MPPRLNTDPPNSLPEVGRSVATSGCLLSPVCAMSSGPEVSLQPFIPGAWDTGGPPSHCTTETISSCCDCWAACTRGCESTKDHRIGLWCGHVSLD